MAHVPALTTARHAPEAQRLVLAYPRPSGGSGVFDMLARQLDLETYGDSLLTRGARSSLRTQAALLMIVFLFDTAIWTVMFNMLLGMGYLRIGWHTAVAVGAALGVAWVMFLWERSIATADTGQGIGTGIKIGIVARVSIVAVAALATALPLELVLFKDEIYQRAYEEAVRYEFVVKVREHEDLEREIADLAARKDTLSRQPPSQADVDPQRQSRMAELKREEYRLRVEAAANREQMIKAPEEERTSWSVKERSTSRELANIRGQIADLENGMRLDQTQAHAARLRLLQGDIACKSERQMALTRWLEKVRKNDFARHPALRDAVTLRSCAALAPMIAPATPAPSNPDAAASATEREAAGNETPSAGMLEAPAGDDPNRAEFYLGVPTLRIFDQVRILWALQKGKPPEWREADDELIKDLQKRYNLRDKSSPATGIYGAFAGVALFVGLVIPLMSVAFKLTGNPEIKNYYSRDAQARAGNPEALHVLESQQHLGAGAPARA